MTKKYNEEYFLTQIKNKFDFLFSDYTFNIVYSKMLNYNAYELLINSSDLFIEFYFDTFEVWVISTYKYPNEKDRFTLETIKQFFINSNEVEDEYFGLDESSNFLRSNLETILDLYSEEKYSNTKSSLIDVSDKIVRKRFPSLKYKAGSSR